jgi:hypothetical protein
VHWNDLVIQEGAGAAFLTIDDIVDLKEASLLSKTIMKEYC